jgi:hypothetical protein
MILDTENLFSDDQAITTTAISDNVIDLQSASILTSQDAPSGINIGPGEGNFVEIIVQVTTNFANGTNIVAALENDDDVTFGSPTVIATGTTVLTADAVAGKQLLALRVLPTDLTERYIAIRYTVSGTHNAGTVTAGVVSANQTNK